MAERRSHDTAVPPDFQRRQLAFAAHVRNPEHAELPTDVPAPRMAVYSELIFNNIENFLRETLPVLHSLLEPAHWQALVRDFLVKHRAHSPYFTDIPREFLSYLDDERDEQSPGYVRDPPFLRELAHYEWVELALSLDERDSPASPSHEGRDDDIDVLTGHPRLSPLAWPLQYRFPVHRITKAFQPTEAPAEPTFLLVYRAADDAVRFMELNAVSARLIGLVVEHADDENYTGRQALDGIARELEHPRPDQVVAHGLDLLRDWLARGIVSLSR